MLFDHFAPVVDDVRGREHLRAHRLDHGLADFAMDDIGDPLGRVEDEALQRAELADSLFDGERRPRVLRGARLGDDLGYRLERSSRDVRQSAAEGAPAREGGVDGSRCESGVGRGAHGRAA